MNPAIIEKPRQRVKNRRHPERNFWYATQPIAFLT